MKNSRFKEFPQAGVYGEDEASVKGDYTNQSARAWNGTERNKKQWYFKGILFFFSAKLHARRGGNLSYFKNYYKANILQKCQKNCAAIHTTAFIYYNNKFTENKQKNEEMEIIEKNNSRGIEIFELMGTRTWSSTIIHVDVFTHYVTT